MRTLLLGLLLIASPALAAGPMTTVDPLGHKTVLNEGGAVPSPEGTVFTFKPLDADIELTLQGTQSTSTEDPDKVLLGLTTSIFVARTTAIGVGISRPDLANPDIIRVAPSLKQYIAVGPSDSWLKFIRIEPFSYSFATGDEAGFSGSGLNVDMRATGGIEVPIGDKIAFQVAAGIVATLSSLGNDVPNTFDPLVGCTAVYRLRPTP